MWHRPIRSVHVTLKELASSPGSISENSSTLDVDSRLNRFQGRKCFPDITSRVLRNWFAAIADDPLVAAPRGRLQLPATLLTLAQLETESSRLVVPPA